MRPALAPVGYGTLKAMWFVFEFLCGKVDALMKLQLATYDDEKDYRHCPNDDFLGSGILNGAGPPWRSKALSRAPAGEWSLFQCTWSDQAV